MKRKPVVGETLYSLNVGNAARNCPQVLTPMVVKHVGRKYFTCGRPGASDYWDVQFHLEDWREKTEYSSNHALYESEQAFEEEKEAGKLFEEIKKTFGCYRRPEHITLDRLKRIMEILQETS